MESRIHPQSDDEDRSIKDRLDKLAEDIKKLPPDRIVEAEKFIHSMGKKAVGLKEAAQMLGVSIDTIRRAVKSGALRAFQINKEGNWKVPIDEVERLMKGE